MRYNSFPPRAVGTFPQHGTGHVSPGMNTRYCASCLVNRPALGGKYRGPLFICALHQVKGVA
jgi:hypothetical protein